MIIKKFIYRPEIDGLRALAVLFVLFYHVGLSFPGGFIGVDIFFVISGFLITSLLIKEMQEERFSFAQFYERRIRRIFPASVALMLITGVAGFFLLLPSDFIGLAKSIFSQTIFGGNFYFWRNTNYFAESAELQPLLHTWSLAVEEQFYMFIPLLLWIIVAKTKKKLKSKLLITLIFILLASFILSIYTLRGMPAFTFYLLPTRAWELLIGSIVAFIPIIPFFKNRYVREALVLIGILCMVIPCFLYTHDTLFPGLAAIPPCLGAAFFIIGTSHEDNINLPLSAKVFTWRPIIFIGLISYSLYLWHWPIIAFSNYWALEDSTVHQKILIVLISFILAIASWRFIETPFRKKSFIPRRKRIYLFALVVSCLMILLSSYITWQNGLEYRFNEKIVAYDRVKSEALKDNRITPGSGLKEAQLGIFPKFGNIDGKRIDLLVWGDSHARCIIPAIEKAADSNYTVATAWYSNTAPLIDYIHPIGLDKFSLSDKNPEWSQSILSQVESNKIRNIILVARWSGFYNAVSYGKNNPKDAINELNDLILKTIARIQRAGARVFILREVPNHKTSVPKALIKKEYFGNDILKYHASKETLASQNKQFDLLEEKMIEAGAKIIDVSHLLFDKENQVYRMNCGGEALYYDNHHLTFFGARYLSEAFKHIFQE